MDDKILSDLEIARLVRSLECEIPPDLDGRIRAAATGPRFRPHPGRRLFWLLTLPSGAAAILAATLLLLPSRKSLIAPPDSSMFTEIRTDFEIPEKNIRIVFFQRPDFKFFEEK